MLWEHFEGLRYVRARFVLSCSGARSCSCSCSWCWSWSWTWSWSWRRRARHARWRRGGGARPGRLRGRPPRRARPAAAAAQELGFEAREQRLLAGGELVRERGVAERRLALLVRQRLTIGGGDRDAGDLVPDILGRARGNEECQRRVSLMRWFSVVPVRSGGSRHVVHVKVVRNVGSSGGTNRSGTGKRSRGRAVPPAPTAEVPRAMPSA